MAISVVVSNEIVDVLVVSCKVDSVIVIILIIYFAVIFSSFVHELIEIKHPNTYPWVGNLSLFS